MNLLKSIIIIGCFILFNCSNSVSYNGPNQVFPISNDTINVADFGAKGDGVTNDYVAFSKAVKEINRHQGGTLIIPQGTYLLDEISDETQNMDLVFQDLNYLKILGNHSIISLKGDYHRKVTRKSRKNSFSAVRSLIPMYIKNSKNIHIEHLEINGNSNLTTRDAKVVEGPGHLLKIFESENIVLNNIKLHHSIADGLNITGEKLPSSNIRAFNVVSTNNARQGLTLGRSENATFIECKFNETGNTGGAYGKHAPSAGLDIEPNLSTHFVKNIYFENCEFKNNYGSQIVISHPYTTNHVNFIKCSIISSELISYRFAVINNAKNVKFDSCMFDLNNGSIYPTWKKPGSSVEFCNCYIKSNDAGIVALSNNIESIVVVKNSILEYTGNAPLKRYFPFIRMKNFVFLNNKIIIPSNKRKSTKYDGLIQDIKHFENNTFISPDGKSIPRISTQNSTLVK